MGLDPVSITLMAVAATSTAVQYSQQRSAQKQQKEGAAVQSAQQRVDANRQKRMAARKARIRRAQVMQASQGTGVGGSSGAVAAGSAASRGVAEKSSYLFGNEVTATAVSRANQNAADKQLRAGLAGSVARVSAGIASDPNQVGVIKDFFGQN